METVAELKITDYLAKILKTQTKRVIKQVYSKSYKLQHGYLTLKYFKDVFIKEDFVSRPCQYANEVLAIS